MVVDLAECWLSWHLISRKNKCIAVYLLLASYSTTATETTGADINQSKCLNSLMEYDDPILCLSKTMEHSSDPTVWCIDNGVILIHGFFVHIPNLQNQSSCPSQNEVIFHYNNTMNSSCLAQFYPTVVRRLMWPLMAAFSGKTSSEVNSSLFVEYFINNNILALPSYSLFKLKHTCFTISKDIQSFHNICDTMNVTGSDMSHIGFSWMSNSNSIISSSVCSCVIRSALNRSQTIIIRAVDVRLAGGVKLVLSGVQSRTLEGPALFWAEDGVLLSSPGDIVIELSGINQSALPLSVWLNITGEDLMLSCGNYSLQNVDLSPDGDTNLWIILVVVVGVVTLILLLVTLILWRCVCRRSHKQYQGVDMVNTSLEVKSTSTHNKASWHNDQATENSLYASNIYFEVEPNTGGEHAPENSTEHSKGAKLLAEDIDNSQQENTYSHLREAKDVNPPADLYDTVHYDEYSRLQRQGPTTVIDNVYNQ